MNNKHFYKKRRALQKGKVIHRKRGVKARNLYIRVNLSKCIISMRYTV